ncbi:MAG TPA: ABC transporter permease [Bryobacteraceae bacterium]|jgi:putative ABC transport system permease protein|nr:ABC transporter permease [Bryobacteraceae bacterium]
MPSSLLPPETEQINKSAERVEAAPAKGGMNIAEAVSFSLEALKANRLRTFLTALGLIIGNASVILVVTISLASKNLILDQIRGIGSNLVYASLESAGENSAAVQADYVKLADVRAIREALGSTIVAAAAVIQNHTPIVIAGKVRDVGLVGVDQYYKPVRNILILTGRPFDESDITLREHVAMLTDKLAIRMFGSLDAAVGQIVKIHQLQFTVIGTFREKTSTFGEGEINEETILIPISMMQIFVSIERVDPVYITVRNAADVPMVTEEVRQILEHRHRAGAKYDVQNLSAILETANSIANVLTIVLIIVSAIALIISGIGIMNIMLVTVTERTREIGLRMAVGASRKEVMLQFLVEAVLISLVGGSIGIVLGLSLPLTVQLITNQVHVPISPLSVLVAFAVSFTVGVGFGLLPARRASQLNPTEALRHE